MDLTQKTDDQLATMIGHHQDRKATDQPLYRQLLEERARRSQAAHKLDLERSLEALQDAARRSVCITYGDLADANGVPWSQARHQMNGPAGHLDHLLDLCHARGLPLLTAICVNQAGVRTGELGDDALTGFVKGARRLGFLVTCEREFHHEHRDKCWQWGRRSVGVA